MAPCDAKERIRQLEAEVARLMLCLEHLSSYVAKNGDKWVQVTARAYMAGANPYDRGVTGDWKYSREFEQNKEAGNG